MSTCVCLEEAAGRDHRHLGRELDIYSVHEEAGAGLIFYHPHGAAIRQAIEDFWMREHIARTTNLLSRLIYAESRSGRYPGITNLQGEHVLLAH